MGQLGSVARNRKEDQPGQDLGPCPQSVAARSVGIGPVGQAGELERAERSRGSKDPLRRPHNLIRVMPAKGNCSAGPLPRPAAVAGPRTGRGEGLHQARGVGAGLLVEEGVPTSQPARRAVAGGPALRRRWVRRPARMIACWRGRTRAPVARTAPGIAIGPSASPALAPPTRGRETKNSGAGPRMPVSAVSRTGRGR